MKNLSQCLSKCLFDTKTAIWFLQFEVNSCGVFLRAYGDLSIARAYYMIAAFSTCNSKNVLSGNCKWIKKKRSVIIVVVVEKTFDLSVFIIRTLFYIFYSKDIISKNKYLSNVISLYVKLQIVGEFAQFHMLQETM